MANDGMRWAGVCLVTTIAFVSTTACSRGTAPEPEDRTPPIRVNAIAVQPAEVREAIEAGGVVAGRTSAAISSRVLAAIRQVRVHAGDRVRAGDVLVVLDDRDADAQARAADAAAVAAQQGLSAALAEQNAATADQTLATAWHGRVAMLHERRSATAQELDDATARLAAANARATGGSARVEQARAQVEGARAAADAAMAQRSFTVITAPFAGTVTERLVDPGNMAAPGTPLLRLEGGGGMRVEARIDEARAPLIRIGDRVDVQIAPDANASAVQGTVAEIARAVASDARAFTVKVDVPSGADLRSGAFARLRFAGPPRSALVIPERALRRQGQLVTTFVVDGNVARMRLLQVGAAYPAGVEVIAGLDAGETVVDTPPPALVDGRRLEITRPSGGSQ